MKKEWILIAYLIVSIFCVSCKETNQIENFNEEPKISNPIEKKQKLMIFGADWCPACNKLKKELNDLDLKNFEIEIINVDENKDLKNKFQISSLPTSVITVDGLETNRKIGYKKNEYQKWINENSKEIKKQYPTR